MTAFARRLIVGEGAPFDPQRGLDLLGRAKALGDAEAPLVEATLAAAGAWRAQSWDDALTLLGEAAARGADLARRQLELLGGPRGADEDWRTLARRVDLKTWFDVPPRKPICEAPRMRVGERFLPSAVCDWLIARAAGRLQRAEVTDDYGAEARIAGHRSNSVFIMDVVRADVVVALVRARISAFVKLPTICFEPPQLLHYAVGEEFKPHFDFLRKGVSGPGEYQGDRLMTFLLYLNDGYEGGETAFPRVGVRHKGAKGDCLVFANVDPAGRPDPLTLHAGSPVSRGEKWALSQWIHDRPYSGVPMV
jgi:prolyl 4-hydroxylase